MQGMAVLGGTDGTYLPGRAPRSRASVVGMDVASATGYWHLRGASRTTCLGQMRRDWMLVGRRQSVRRVVVVISVWDPTARTARTAHPCAASHYGHAKRSQVEAGSSPACIRTALTGARCAFVLESDRPRLDEASFAPNLVHRGKAGRPCIVLGCHRRAAARAGRPMWKCSVLRQARESDTEGRKWKTW